MSAISTQWPGSTAAPGTSIGTSLRRNLAAWAYSGGRRDLRLDLLRGFAAFSMIADHLAFGSMPWLGYLTGGDHFSVSAAEAFVLISGLVMGMVYRHVSETNGARSIVAKAAKRAVLLYAVTVGVSVSFLYLSWLAKAPWGPGVTHAELGHFLLQFVTLRRTFYLVDIPLLYTMLIVLAVPAVLLLRAGLGRVVFFASIATWGLWQVAPGSVDLPWRVVDNNVFFLPSWQVIFFVALVGGWYRDEIAATLGRIPAFIRWSGAALLTAAAAGLYSVLVLAMGALAARPGLRDQLFDKGDVTPARLASLVVFAGFAYLVTTLAWQPINRLTGWLLIPLGQASLAVYMVHVYVVLAVAKVIELTLHGRPTPGLLTTDFQLAAILAIWLVLRIQSEVKQTLREAQAKRKPSPRLEPASAGRGSLYHAA